VHSTKQIAAVATVEQPAASAPMSELLPDDISTSSSRLLLLSSASCTSFAAAAFGCFSGAAASLLCLWSAVPDDCQAWKQRKAAKAQAWSTTRGSRRAPKCWCSLAARVSRHRGAHLG